MKRAQAIALLSILPYRCCCGLPATWRRSYSVGNFPSFGIEHGATYSVAHAGGEITKVEHRCDMHRDPGWTWIEEPFAAAVREILKVANP